MQNEIIAAIDQEIARLSNLQEKIKYVDRKLTDLYSQWGRADRALNKLKAAPPVNQVREDVKKRGPAILLKHLKIAYATNSEFEHEKFSSRLEAAINDPNTYLVVPDQDGKLRVVINLDATAGTLSEYYKAVKEVRETVGDRKRGKQLPPPALAAYMWMEKYYKPAREGTSVPYPPNRKKKRKDPAKRDEEFRAKYWATIDARLASMSSLAPWWRLINDGLGPSLNKTEVRKGWSVWNPASDGKPGFTSGGSNAKPYPVAKRTSFVEHAEAELQSIIYESDATETDDERNELLRLIDKLNAAIAYLEGYVFNIEDPRQEVATLIERQLGERFSRADQTKLNNLIDKITAGEFVGRTRLGADVRVSTQEIQNVVAEYNSRRR